MGVRRTALWALAVVSVAVGAWGLLAPGSFYASFPAGRGWVAADGPFNEHLLRDFGALNLALGVLTAVAAVRMRPDLVRLVGIVTLVYAVPHLTYHALHLGLYGPADIAGNMVTLGTSVVLPLWLAVWPAPRTARGGARALPPTVPATDA